MFYLIRKVGKIKRERKVMRLHACLPGRHAKQPWRAAGDIERGAHAPSHQNALRLTQPQLLRSALNSTAAAGRSRLTCSWQNTTLHKN